MLWIGFKILYLCDLKQYCQFVRYCKQSCELVSKFCIFVIWNSIVLLQWKFIAVVNWFQNFVSLWSETVIFRFYLRNSKLWIGFKILYLCDLKQLDGDLDNVAVSCELVSKFCIFVIWNSWVEKKDYYEQLWIGFKILYLCDLKQLHNIQEYLLRVVNWFQNFVSLWSETVRRNWPRTWNWLWIGFKILYLCDLKQYYGEIGLPDIVVNWFQNFVSLWSETVQTK